MFPGSVCAVPCRLFLRLSFAGRYGGGTAAVQRGFLVTILSLLVQGTTVSWMANLLGLGYAEKSPAFGVDVHEDIPSIFTEVLVNESMLQGATTLKEINLPEHTLVMMVYRDGDYFVPQGNTALKVGDKLLVISDRGEELESTYKDMGVDEVLKL